MATSQPTVESVRNAVREVQDRAVKLGVRPSTYEGSDETVPTVAQRRRRRQQGLPDTVGLASLMINDDGVLFWNLGDIDGVRSGRRALRRGVPDAPEGKIVELYHYDKLETNTVNNFLQEHDAELNDHQGLRLVTLKAGAPQTEPYQNLPTGKKKRLLFVHGTFSKSEALFDGMMAAPGGPAAVTSLFGRYDEVLAFDHATLSVSPAMNAFDLVRMLAKADGPMDVITHSRGGLVTRWAFEGYGMNGSGPYRAVLVGSPLNGTSLASPPRLKSALSLLSNFGTVLKTAGAAASAYAPLLLAPLALVRIASSVVSFAAKTPVVDGAVMMIAGLHGQSRIANHPELTRLRAVKLARPPKYFVVKANFETEDPGWKFWRWFRKDRLEDLGADLVFPGPNDLVVDTESMSDIPTMTFQPSSIKDFGTTPAVYHTNYFEQADTLDFILDKLK